MGPYDKPFSPQEYLMHYGVKGMKWGVRRYQNKDGTLFGHHHELHLLHNRHGPSREGI